jgi:predicted nucleic acid-binding protein
MSPDQGTSHRGTFAGTLDPRAGRSAADGRNWSPTFDPGTHRLIALDSNVLIYLLETTGAIADVAARIVDAVDAGETKAILSAVGLVEILTGPARVGDAAAFELTAEALRDLPIRVVPLDGARAEDAARIRGALGIGLEDAVHLASAREAGATAFITNDRRLRSIPRLEVIYMDDLVA